jgi:hypothetical protein
MDSNISAKLLYFCAGVDWSAGGGVQVASMGFRIDLRGFDTRVWGRGRSGELRRGVECIRGKVEAGMGHGLESKFTRFFLLVELEGVGPSDKGDVRGVLRSALVTKRLAGAGVVFVAKGSFMKSSRSASSVLLSFPLDGGGVGGRTARDWSLDTMAMQKTK